ncbi:alpha-latrotoxin-Lg1a-like [Microplitis mediator]|uniref:alpha-latrotoxin-Lg1a-like n=1 Tax=Microplitis mediator TaxID=375433 RepID=UPI00255675EF|nr:alpha-latrotoxin-Lg1a-like [Microplitis mediator]
MRKSKIRQSKMQKVIKCRVRRRQSESTVFRYIMTAILSHDEDHIDNSTTESISVDGYHSCMCQISVLHIAAVNGNYSIFKKFIDLGADIYKRIGKTQFTVLHAAAKSSNYDIVKYLIENGLDVNVVINDIGPMNGETALHFVAEKGTKEVTTLLLDNNASINAKSAIGITPLIKAVEARNYDAMDVLIKYAPDLFCTYEKDGYTETIFHSAISNSNWEVLYDWLFLFADAIDVNNNDTNFFSFFKSQLLLHHALRYRPIEVEEAIISYLLEVGVDVNALDSNNKLAIECESALEFRPHSIKLIKEHIVELIAAGFYVCDRNIQAVSTKEFDHHSAKCRLEVEKMKKNQLEDSNITFIKILQKNELYVAPYLKSVDLDNIFEHLRICQI